METDIVIVGAGPAGIFTAIEMLKKGSKQKIILVEKGQPVEKRHCPKAKTKKCVNCKPYCHITTGFSGAGAFSDGKLSLSYEVGGDLPSLIGEDLAQETIDYTDKIYLEFGADEHVEGLGNTEEVKEIRKRAIQAGLKLVDCPIRHLGTEKAQDLYLSIEKHLQNAGVEMIFGYACTDLILDGDVCRGVRITNGKDSMEITAKHTVIATGRRGADWLEQLCASYSIAHQPGTVDIGVRVEVRNEIMEKVNEVLYESKLIGYPPALQEQGPDLLPETPAASSVRRTTTTIWPWSTATPTRSSRATTPIWPSSAPTLLGALQPAHRLCPEGRRADQYAGQRPDPVQRFGDILDGKRTWPKELAQSNLKPTLVDAVAGDITAAMPYPGHD